MRGSPISVFLGRLVVVFGVMSFVSLGSATPGAAQVARAQSIADRFLQNPSQALQQYPDGGPGLVSFLREAAIGDPKSLPAIVGLIANANKGQKTAIGAALGQAAKIVVRTNQAYATQIVQAIAETKDQDVFLAYSGVVPDQGTASIGGGGGAGAGGGAGGQTNALGGAPTSTGAATPIGGGSTGTAQFSYTSSVTGDTTTSFQTISSSTSP